MDARDKRGHDDSMYADRALTSSVVHLRENLGAVGLKLPENTISELDGIATAARAA